MEGLRTQTVPTSGAGPKRRISRTPTAGQSRPALTAPFWTHQAAPHAERLEQAAACAHSGPSSQALTFGEYSRQDSGPRRIAVQTTGGGGRGYRSGCRFAYSNLSRPRVLTDSKERCLTKKPGLSVFSTPAAQQSSAPKRKRHRPPLDSTPIALKLAMPFP